MLVSGCLRCLDILRTLLTFFPAGLNCQSQRYLSRLSSFYHLELLKASLIVYFLDTCYQLETFNSPCPLLSAVHSLPVLTCLQLYWMLLPPPTSDVNPPPQFLCVQFLGGHFLSPWKWSSNASSVWLLRPLPFPQCSPVTVLILPVQKSSTVNNLHFTHRKSFLATRWKKKYGTSVAGHKHHSITCYPKNQVQK